MKRRVMIVDDEPDIRLTVRAVLEPRGIEVIPVVSGAACIEELEKGFSGVVLMDLMMPEMDGVQTIGEISNRGLGDKVLVALLTAKDNPEKQVEGVTDTVVKCLRKPFDSLGLTEQVGRLLAQLETQLNSSVL